MNLDIILSIKEKMNNLIGLYNYYSQSDIFGFLTKMCIDEILKLNDELVYVSLNTNGDIDLKINDEKYLFDIKTQDINKTYSFPNLLSIKKAKDLLTNDKQHLYYIFVEYEDLSNKIRIDNIRVQKIESFEWSYLYIQNIGRGQLQIKNITRNEFQFNNQITRSEWLNTLKEKGIEYYDSLMLKVVEYKTEWSKDESLDN